ncbi:MAG: hypothetical protein IJG67_02530 [Oscillospiraceae bacterium]|nr:hypothetical protein [Oscillospiraceae bacterium]
MARKEYEKERYDDARRYYAKALEEDPDSWEADLGVATCDMLKSKWNDYRADQFKSNIKEIRKQIDKLPESEIYEAKYTLGGMIADVALYVNNELEDSVYDRWMRNIENGRRYPEPDVSSHELMEDVKDWILEETQLMFESEPGDGPIPEDKVKLIEMLFNYVYAKDTYTIVLEGYGTHPIDDYFRNKKDMYMKMLEKRNPGYKFYQNVTLRY